MALSKEIHLTSQDYYSAQRYVQNANVGYSDATKGTEMIPQKSCESYLVTGSQESLSSNMDYSSSQESSASKMYSSSQESSASKMYSSSQESSASKMYSSSQESSASKMYYSSQENSASNMEYSSSQESNTSTMDCLSVDNIACNIEITFEENALPSEKAADKNDEKNKTIEKISEVTWRDLSDAGITSRTKSDFNAGFGTDICLTETIKNKTEKGIKNINTSKRKISDDDEFHAERLLSIREKAILSREKELAKWELAILIREHALEEHAIVLREQEDILNELFDKNSSVAKRLKI